jgi:hypothetical protein
VLLVVGAPGQLQSLAGQEHGRTIPLASLRHHQLPHCKGLFDHLVAAEKVVLCALVSQGLKGTFVFKPSYSSVTIQ